MTQRSRGDDTPGPALARRAAAAVLVALCVGIGSADDETWRSELYPDDWTPATTADDGRFLHDFSYAGYRRGEVEPPLRTTPALDAVRDHDADPTGQTDSTAAIQAALDAAGTAGGGVVYLPPGQYRCDDLLTIDDDGVVLRGAGPDETLLQFTRDTDMTDRAGLTIRGSVTRGPDLDLAADGVQRAHVVELTDASTLRVGDEVAVGWTITDAFVEEHGMTGTWRAFNGTWRPFFRRTVTDLDTTSTPHRVSLDIPLRYPAKVRDGASLRIETGYTRECGVESMSVTNAVSRSAAWDHDRAHAVEFRGAADGWMADVHSAARPDDPGGDHLQSGGVLVVESKRITIADCSMARAQHRGGGGNGYLFEVSRSGEVLFVDCEARDGRHNFIQNWSFGTTGSVFLRCRSEGSRAYFAEFDPFGFPAYSEFHHSLATANLVDSCELLDGWYAGNRGDESTGAGHTSTENVFWNLSGGGLLRSYQYGRGYVIGPGDMNVLTTLGLPNTGGTAPVDDVETGPGRARLSPSSLHEDQLDRRTGRTSATWRVRNGRVVDDEREDRDSLTLDLAPDTRPDRRFSPATDDLRIDVVIGGVATTWHVPAGSPDWRRRRDRWVHRTPRGETPRRTIEVRRRSGRVTVTLSRANLTGDLRTALHARVELGPDAGRARSSGRPAAKLRRRQLARVRF